MVVSDTTRTKGCAGTAGAARIVVVVVVQVEAEVEAEAEAEEAEEEAEEEEEEEENVPGFMTTPLIQNVWATPSTGQLNPVPMDTTLPIRAWAM
jgi:hypothetical protein